MFTIHSVVLFVIMKVSCQKGFVEENKEYPNEHLKYHWKEKSLDHCHIDNISCKKNTSAYCWGYEDNCAREKMFFSYPTCHQLPSHGIKNLEEEADKYWRSADFGYVKERIDSLEFLCEPKVQFDSALVCSENWEHCAAENIYINLRNTNFDQSERFHSNFFKVGEIGGACKLNSNLMEKTPRLPGELNSWNAELKDFTSLNHQLVKQSSFCDEEIFKPTIFMKLDSGVNMFHHFCDFLNLYITQHVNGSFSTDIYIVMWDTSKKSYNDLFSETWKAFTRYPLKRLSDFAGKRVCFHNALFSLPPRTIFGLYYNTPLPSYCKGGGLFKAFSEHVLHRLQIFQQPYQNNEIRVTLLKRSTQYRRILNEEELIGAMKRMEGLNVTAIDFNYREVPFLEQLKISRNSDIFIGMHGAGLTHMIFQPDWGAVFEIYNTEDPNCYRDLANLRGLQYFTWEHTDKLFQEDEGHHPTLGAHAKFTNYAFDVDEFLRLLTKAIKHVLNHRSKSGDRSR